MEQNILEQILDGTTEPTDLPLETLRKITDNFSRNRIIGEGGFGTVYKGVLRNGDVAVKKIMSSMTVDEKLFRREVDSLMVVNHQNIVKFLGFCSHTAHTALRNQESRGYIYAEKRERLLCFEYISNGSLDKYITDELRGLEWDTRYRVIKGICAGLYYLHMEKRILHLDLKPADILLDNQMVSKITDFGLSRPTENSRTSANHFSSLGYDAPENLFGHGRLSVQSDIYSLGIIIIELVSGHKGIRDGTEKIVRRWRHRWNKSTMETPLAYQEQVVKCIEIGIMCQSIDPYRRPFISDIMKVFDEMGCMNNHISGEPTIAQINFASWEDDMLGVEPLELRFANYDHNSKHISSSCSVELSNNTNDFIAFNIQTTSPLPYCIDPNNNIVPPLSKLSVDITLQEATQNHDKAISQYNTKQYEEQFAVRSIKVNEGLTVEDINQDMFDKGEDVDEIHLTVVSEAPPQATSCVPLSEESCIEEVDQLPGDNVLIFKQLMDANQQYTSVLTDNLILKSDVEVLRAKLKLMEDMVARGATGNPGLSPAALNQCPDVLPGRADDFGSLSLAEQVHSSRMQSMASLERLEHRGRMPGGGDFVDISGWDSHLPFQRRSI